jgi:F0F1-type ATP synthase membrane subunit c/vacuolar-type H+-ATPase subunit K
MRSLPAISVKFVFSAFLSLSIIVIIGIFIDSLLPARSVYAQEDSVIAVSVEVLNEDVEEGMIVSLVDGSYVLSTREYDSRIFGVVVFNPSLSLQDTNLENFQYVATSGEAPVRVSGANGNIKAGDYITSSNIAGIGQRVDTNGYVVGIALEDYTFESPNDVILMYAYIDTGPVVLERGLDRNIFELLRSGFRVPFLTPLTAFRYILAALVSLVAFLIGFSSFGRISGSSIEALGRNPLASKSIRSTVILNFLFTLGVVLIGLAISYLILSL